MGKRERTLEPRVDDDFDMMGMQFNVKQYSVKDRIFTDGLKNGLAGFAGQVDRSRNRNEQLIPDPSGMESPAQPGGVLPGLFQPRFRSQGCARHVSRLDDLGGE